MRILISVCGEGFGHTTRCIAIGKELLKKHDVRYAAYGKSKDFIEMSGGVVFETYPEIKLSGKDGKFDVTKSIFNSDYHPARAIKKELDIIRTYEPDLIISDCKYSSVIASKIAKKPYYIITNQNYTKTDKKEKYIVYPVMSVLNVIHNSAEKVIIPDLPCPYTICEYNLKMLENLAFIGPLIRYDVNPEEINDEGYILSVIGGFEYRFKILELLNKLSNKKGIKIKMVCGSYDVAKKLEAVKSENVEIIPMTTEMDKLIKDCSFLVCHGGHSTLMEAVCFGKPIITIPDMGHPEQENNAKKINDLECGIALSYKNLESELENAIEKVSSNPKYLKNAKKLQKSYLNHKGTDKILNIVENGL
ncbi:Glycosyltransferase 28 domain [Methanococcus vannielii SB]|jgi:uncharacterized protein (TIGR00661 family)|uniref:Glycosyltransferase 28 domain n=1 Tax=Methanococcus vannielii (strain ATCC 35089 / DSM 1224 / JCM 13029 / OCM 148 / SB) TaxID=406327 RepID=A6US16_METVS|nr:MJ1255/VC2487 family glycosyltransferase [Methanococcus vannielii]ABR55288.1 Glycosyltransferase 28 domain [Methanococcus vannielii SB]